MSPVQTLFGASTVKFRASRFGATGKSCALLSDAKEERIGMRCTLNYAPE